MVDNLGPKKDPEVRLRFFSMLAENLQYCQKTVLKQNQLHTFVRLIIQGMCNTNLNMYECGQPFIQNTDHECSRP